jgi:FdhD protein
MSFKDLSIIRVRAGLRAEGRDAVAVEAPLEIRLHGRPFAVVMRTPGADRELAAGFLLSERVIEQPEDLGLIEFCRDATTPSSGEVAADEQVVNVVLAGAASASVEQRLLERRDIMASAACGVCGRLTIDTLGRGLAPLSSSLVVSTSRLLSLSARLREAQPVFNVTGGLHAAGLFDRAGVLVTSAEDVGRHNAVDKVVGRMLMAERLPLDDHMLCVSGRTSFEIVQKAWCAGIPIVAAVSAPSSLAIDLAARAGITLVGFARDGGANIYTRPERITDS